MNRYEVRLVAIQTVDGKESEKVVDTFNVSSPKPSASGKLNMHAGGKLNLNGDRWQFGANITKIGAPAQ